MPPIHVISPQIFACINYFVYFCSEIIKVKYYGEKNLTKKEALERLQKSIKAKKDYITETRVALENEYIQRFGVKPSNYNVW